MKYEAYRAKHDRAHRRAVSAKIVRGDDPNCRRKHRHADQVTALASAMHSLACHPEDGVDRLYAYRCEACRGWHLTKSDRLNKGAAYSTAEVTVWP